MALLSLLLLLAVGPAQSFPVQDVRRGLEGIAGLKVEVEGFGVGDVERATGLTKDQIKADVEQQLRSAGIKVGNEFKPYLYVEINAANVGACGSVTRYYANVTIRFRQMVTVRENGKTVDGATWESSQLNIGPCGESVSIDGSIEGITEGFINDYLAANPKK